MPYYRFDEFELQTDLFELRRNGDLCPMEPQVFTVLAYLVEHHDRVVSKAELIDHVWHDRFISEAALTSRLMAARKVLGDSGQEQRYIKTVHGRGYRFVSEVAGPGTAISPAPQADPPSSADPVQDIRFCTSADGTRIAYASTGSGPPLVKAANWLSHLEFDWESPVWRHWMEELSRDFTLARYDQRGCGLSDWNVTDFSLEPFVSDLEAVVDAMQLEKFPLLGISQGGAVALAYAVRHPERVTKLVLYGAYAQGRLRRATTQDEIDEHEALITLIRLCWGRDDPSFRQLFASGFIPGASPEQHRWFNDLCRVSTTPDNAACFRRAFGDVDVTDLLPQVSCPTLVLHAMNEERVPVSEGKRIAAAIPGARFVPLQGRNHILLEDEPAWPRFLTELRTFLAADQS
jgi:pimeloyl-ACP methyl ester carboxylesterase/DNA-binding winged helix-turn-helix (wHTH) protein